MKELAKTLEKQFSGNAESRAAGMVINTMGWVEGLGYEVSSAWLQMTIGYLQIHIVALCVVSDNSVLCSAVTSQRN
jgi:hypothetical protein